MFALLVFTIMTQFAFAANDVDANATREAVGFNGITMIPILILVVFLVVLGFATQRIPGLKS